MIRSWRPAPLLAGLMAWLMAACSPQGGADLPPLPVAHSNNAAASIEHGGRTYLYSFAGLTEGKTHADTSVQAWRLDLDAGEWTRLDDLPVPEGRLAATALAMDGLVYVIGGYSVAPDGSEVSAPEVLAFSPETGEYRRLADMPVPVDDTVAFSYRDRFIYLVSGWHDTGNVDLVQVYDAHEDRWFEATPYPGAPVFGHAGGAVDGDFVIADGVAVTGVVDGRRRFGAVDQAWRGQIDPDDPAVISWTRLDPHPGGPLYRLAAAGNAGHNRVLFAGGGDNPYNYDGIGYDGVPAEPSDAIFAFDFDTGEWVTGGRLERASMDHRALLRAENSWLIIGGMNGDREVTGQINRVVELPPDR